MKRVMEVIVGLLKDRVDVEKEPAMKSNGFKGISKKTVRHLYISIKKIANCHVLRAMTQTQPLY